jgi:hypothetical protein
VVVVVHHLSAYRFFAEHISVKVQCRYSVATIMGISCPAIPVDARQENDLNFTRVAQDLRTERCLSSGLSRFRIASVS